MAASNALFYTSSSVCCCIFTCLFFPCLLVSVFFLLVSFFLVYFSPLSISPSPCLLVCYSAYPYSDIPSPACRDAAHLKDPSQTLGSHRPGLCAAPRSALVSG